MNNCLFILSCTKTKIWDIQPVRGAFYAEDAYQGQLFLKGKKFIRRHFPNATYVILSAKYGWLAPEHLIYDYNETFKTKKPNIPLLISQASALNLDLNWSKVVVLGGSVYANVCLKVFHAPVKTPLFGLPIGKMLQALTPPNDKEVYERVIRE